MRNSQCLIHRFKGPLILAALFVFIVSVKGEVEGISQSPPDLEGTWKGWGGVELKRDSYDTYTGTYGDTYGTDVGRILLEMSLEEGGENSGEWWEGVARIGTLNFKVSEDGTVIRGTWCALDSSEIKPGEPSCDHPRGFTWSRKE